MWGGGRLINPTLRLMVPLIWQGVAPTPSHLENFLLHRRPSARFSVFKSLWFVALARQVVPNAPAPKGSSSWNPFNSSPTFTLSRDRQRCPVHCTGHWEAGRKWGYHVPQNAQLKLSSWTPKVERQMHRLPRRARTIGVFRRAQQRLVRAKISRGFHDTSPVKGARQNVMAHQTCRNLICSYKSVPFNPLFSLLTSGMFGQSATTATFNKTDHAGSNVGRVSFICCSKCPSMCKTSINTSRWSPQLVGFEPLQQY